MSWNASYTRQKQKEMTENAINASKNKPTTFRPSTMAYSTYSRKMAQERRERISWRIGYCIMSIVVIFFVLLFVGLSQ
tara:strand:+ start:278 stop:511 length:234 start_codon:yes stop_codon:yes gene_type:complete